MFVDGCWVFTSRRVMVIREMFQNWKFLEQI